MFFGLLVLLISFMLYNFCNVYEAYRGHSPLGIPGNIKIVGFGRNLLILMRFGRSIDGYTEIRRSDRLKKLKIINAKSSLHRWDLFLCQNVAINLGCLAGGNICK